MSQIYQNLPPTNGKVSGAQFSIRCSPVHAIPVCVNLTRSLSQIVLTLVGYDNG